MFFIRTKKDYQIKEQIKNLGLCSIDNELYSLKYGKNGFHTEYLGYILAEMQHLPLLYPDATW